MSPESQKSSLTVTSVIVSNIAIAINPSVLLKFLGPEKNLKIDFITKLSSIKHPLCSVELSRLKKAENLARLSQILIKHLSGFLLINFQSF